MSTATFNEALHPRVTTGQFAVKANSEPDAQLIPEPTAASPETTRNTLLIGGRPYTSREPGADEIIVHDVLPGMPRIAGGLLSQLAVGAPESNGSNWVIRAEVIGASGQTEATRDVAVPTAGSLLICEHQGSFMTIDDLDGRGVTLLDVEIHHDELVALPDADDEPVDLDSVRKELSGNGHVVNEVNVIRSGDDSSLALIQVHITDNLKWNDLLTEDELDTHRAVVEEVYSEWFQADIDVLDDWSNVSVTLRTDIDVSRATPRLILERAWGSHAKFINETDPGTFGSPYVGAEIRRRLDARIALSDQQPAA